LRQKRVFLDLQLPQKRVSKNDIYGRPFGASPIKEKGKNFKSIKVPNHLIGSHISPGLFYMTNITKNPKNENTLFSSEYISKLSKNIFQKPDGLWIIQEFENINFLFSLYGFTHNEKENYLIDHSDFIVGRRSQISGRSDDPKYNNFYKEFYDYYRTYTHDNTRGRSEDGFLKKVSGLITEVSGIEVGNYVMELLLSPISTKTDNYPNDSKFANILEAVTQPEIDDPILKKPIKQQVKNRLMDNFSPSIRLISPENKETIQAENKLNVVFEVSDTSHFQIGTIEFQDEYYYLDSIKNTNTITIPIQYNKIGTNYLRLNVVYNTEDNYISLDTLIQINVRTNDELIDFVVEPKTSLLKVSEKYYPSLSAFFTKGITDISNSVNENVEVTFSQENVVTFDTLYKAFQALNIGSTIATINYRGFEQTVYFEVDGALPKPEGNIKLIFPPNDTTIKVNSTLLTWSPVSNTLTYTLEIAKDTNFYSNIIDGRELLDTVYSLDDFDYNTTYYWRVKAIGLGGDSPWSDTWSFTTIKQELKLDPIAVDTLFFNEQFQIGWNYNSVDNVLIQFSTDGGTSWINMFDTPIPASLKKFDWHVPAFLTNHLYIRIIDASNPQLNDVSKKLSLISGGLELDLVNKTTCYSKPMKIGIEDISSLKGSGFYQFTWTPAIGLNNPKFPNPTVQSPTKSTTYKLTVQDMMTGRTKTDSMLLRVDSKVYVDVESYITKKTGTKINLFSLLKEPQQSNDYIFTWRKGLSKQVVSDPTNETIANGLTYYYIQVVPVNGCQGSEKKITIHGSQLGKEIDENKIITGLQESSVLHIYPNPVDEVITIYAHFIEETISNIHIYDYNGREVFTQEYQPNTFIQENISLDKLSPGVYQIVVRTNNDILIGKFIKI